MTVERPEDPKTGIETFSFFRWLAPQGYTSEGYQVYLFSLRHGNKYGDNTSLSICSQQYWGTLPEILVSNYDLKRMHSLKCYF